MEAQEAVKRERLAIIIELEKEAVTYDEFAKLDYLLPEALERYRVCANLLRRMAKKFEDRGV